MFAIKSLPKGKEMSDHALEEHLEVKKDLKKLDNMAAGSPGFDALLRKIMGELTAHVKEEETDFIPTLQKHASPNDLQEMAKQWYSTQKGACTHPHPSAPDKPPLQTVVNKLGAPLDKARDLMRDFPEAQKK